MTFRNLIGPVLGGLLADPAALYPSIFPQDSLWTSYPFLLPNLAVALLQVFTFILALCVLQETHPDRSRMPGHPVTALSVLQSLKKFFIRHDRTQSAAYSRLSEDYAGLEAREDATEEHPLEDFQEEQGDGARKSSGSETLEADKPAKKLPDRAFRSQVIMQILAVSLLAFHKVASDSLMGTFLALESGGSDKPQAADGATPRGISFPHSRSGFGFDTRMIGIIFLTEAIFRAVIQPTVIPWFISKLGALRAFRWVLGLYPAMYILTPFFPKIASPLQFVLLLLDLWMKVALSSVGYICSAVLYVKPHPTRRRKRVAFNLLTFGFFSIQNHKHISLEPGACQDQRRCSIVWLPCEITWPAS